MEFDKKLTRANVGGENSVARGNAIATGGQKLIEGSLNVNPVHTLLRPAVYQQHQRRREKHPYGDSGETQAGNTLADAVVILKTVRVAVQLRAQY